MISLKNNKLVNQHAQSLCKTHNDKKKCGKKTKLTMCKSHNYTKVFHPLKNRKVKLHKLVLTLDTNRTLKNMPGDRELFYQSGTDVLSKKYSTKTQFGKKEREWSSESNIVDWLQSIGIDIRRLSSGKYLLKGRECLINHVLVFANKKRIESGLSPFYIDGLTEC